MSKPLGIYKSLISQYLFYSFNYILSKIQIKASLEKKEKDLLKFHKVEIADLDICISIVVDNRVYFLQHEVED